MNKDKKSASVQVRVNFEDISTISEFVLSAGARPDTASKAISAGVS